MTTPDVTVVTVTYNAAGLVLDCLDALASQRLDGLRMEIVVVDNASIDTTAELVARCHPSVRLIRSPTNLGFAGGNNLALRAVRSRSVILLNNDARPDPDLVRTLVTTLDRAPAQVAGLTATILLAQRFSPATSADDDHVVVGPDGVWIADDEGDVDLVNSTGNEIRTDGYGADRGWLADASRHEPGRDVFGFCGAAAILRMSALDDVGLFDETFFMYYEDSDLSWRLRLAGYRIEHCAPAVVRHEHAASSGEGSDLFRFHDARNRLLMITKNATARLALRVVTRYVLTTASITMRRSQPSGHIRIRWRALASFARLLPSALRLRREIGRAARSTRAEVETHLVEPPARPTGGFRA